jgi:hypothetical protein
MNARLPFVVVPVFAAAPTTLSFQPAIRIYAWIGEEYRRRAAKLFERRGGNDAAQGDHLMCGYGLGRHARP